MKKRLWCIALTLIMVVTLASGITVPVSAADEEFTEVIYFEENEDVKSTHFWLSSERVFPGGWGIGPYPKNPLTVHSTYSDIIITGLDLDITPGSNSWDNVSCDYGRNTGTTGSVGHIEDIYSRTVFLTAPWQDYVLVGNVTVHYKLHPSHDYS